jgi:hypothetical protein
MSNILHLLNVADWALMAAGLAATLLMMVVGADGDPGPERKPVRPRRRRRDSR